MGTLDKLMTFLHLQEQCLCSEEGYDGDDLIQLSGINPGIPGQRCDTAQAQWPSHVLTSEEISKLINNFRASLNSNNNLSLLLMF